MPSPATTDMVKGYADEPDTSTNNGGTKESSDESESSEGSVDITEEFQREVQEIITPATKVELDYLRSKIMDREKELMKSETKAEKSGDFDMEGVPE